MISAGKPDGFKISRKEITSDILAGLSVAMFSSRSAYKHNVTRKYVPAFCKVESRFEWQQNVPMIP
jgi:hypothetical protein